MCVGDGINMKCHLFCVCVYLKEDVIDHHFHEISYLYLDQLKIYD